LRMTVRLKWSGLAAVGARPMRVCKGLAVAAATGDAALREDALRDRWPATL
jgi:hypothetical protein